MKTYFIDNHSDTLLLFFSGWGCDDYEFEHLKSDFDVLIFYDYTDLNFEFDFLKYKEFKLISFSAGVFVASLLDLGFEIKNKVAISGNPYLFDEHFGLPQKIQELLYNITEDTADDFARNYLVKTDDEWKNFHHSKRSLESCRHEFDRLKKIYNERKQDIKDIYDFAIFGSGDELFNLSAQKGFYKNKIKIVENARHNIFFRIEKYEQIFDLEILGVQK